jgi:hypothetical protein
MSDEAPRVRIRAVTPLCVDFVDIAPGEVAEIRAELLPDLVRVGAAELELEPEAAPASDTLPGGATPDGAGASPVDAAEGGVAPEAPGEAAPPPAAEEAPGGVDPAEAAAPATRKGKRA